MNRFNQNPSFSRTSNGDVTLQWITDRSDNEPSITARVPNSHDENLEHISNLICHHQIEKMPAEGLNELANTLQELIEFYTERHNADPSTPDADVTRIAGLMTGERERPHFFVTE